VEALPIDYVLAGFGKIEAKVMVIIFCRYSKGSFTD